MTFDEFKLAYQPLANKWAHVYAKPDLRQAMFESVKGFQLDWVHALVRKIIMTNKPDFNISEEIEKEKRMRGFERVNSENAEEMERMRRNSTGMGYDAELRKLGAQNLWDAVTKSKGQAG